MALVLNGYYMNYRDNNFFVNLLKPVRFLESGKLFDEERYLLYYKFGCTVPCCVVMEIYVPIMRGHFPCFLERQ